MPPEYPSKDVPDAQIVARVLAGEREEYAELVRRHQAALYRHALGMVGSPDAAADLTQECLIRAFTRLQSCNDPARFGAWSFRILRNSCLDYLKDRRRQAVGIEDEGVLGVANGDPELSLEQRELREAVFRALDQLPDSQKEAFLLKHVEELSYEEMTEQLGASTSALKMRVKRAREALQTLLAVRRGEEL
ncbi:MAG: sigma-70 family RNA polymerase sigma factor [Gemmatimonas sp.]|nr:sigma-70 family RNA polymerase sigma factor [Gemmatimonas sp.]